MCPLSMLNVSLSFTSSTARAHFFPAALAIILAKFDEIVDLIMVNLQVKDTVRVTVRLELLDQGSGLRY